MPIPDYQSLMLPVLRFAGDRKEHSVADIRQHIAAELKLSEKELAERLASDSQTVFANRIGWAVQYLKAAVALKSVKRGVYQITDRGMAILKEKPSEITVKTLRQFPEFLEFHGHGTVSESAEVSAVPSSRPITSFMGRKHVSIKMFAFVNECHHGRHIPTVEIKRM
jgi:restriction system protein